MTEDQSIMYSVEEEDDEEETITIDFDNKQIYSKEETIIVRERTIPPGIGHLAMGSVTTTPGTWQSVYPPPAPAETTVTTLPYITTADPHVSSGISVSSGQIQTATIAPPPEPSFELELQNYFLDKMTSKAIASLLSKLNKLGDEMDPMPGKKRMGKLGDMIQDNLNDITFKRRAELRQCFSGGIVRYDRIPKWAREYVRDYIGNMVHGLSVLTDDEN